jgi:hypothetical protein
VYKTEKQRDEQARTEAERAQAVRVSGWCAQYSEVRSDGTPTDTRWHVFVRNASELPIYNVEIKFYFPTHVAGGEPATESAWVERGQITFSIAVPGAEPTRCPLSSGMLRQVGQEDANLFRPSLTFTDSAGRHWHRDRSGTLTNLVTRP